MLSLDVLVIGAGMSGLIAATQLAKNGHKVACVEKARGSGGRLSSKRITSTTGETISFDLGASSFCARTELFRSHLDGWLERGLVKTWHYSAEHGAQYVAVPRSSSLTRYLADSLEVHFATRVSEIKRDGENWQIFTGDAENRTLFATSHHIVFATPPQQAADLLPNTHPYKAELSQSIELPQWVLMMNVKGRLALAGHYHQFQTSIISKLVLEQSKPERKEMGGHQVWVVQADTDWTAENLETDKSTIERLLIAEVASITGSPVIVDDTHLHRWLYSVPTTSSLSGKQFLSDQEGLWFCGDYLADIDNMKGVEAAFYSGYQLAKNFQTKQIHI
ncbi:MAG: NAD(P)/FAD-dependent oxidoreductase [Oleiphilus sp.]